MVGVSRLAEDILLVVYYFAQDYGELVQCENNVLANIFIHFRHDPCLSSSSKSLLYVTFRHKRSFK